MNVSRLAVLAIILAVAAGCGQRPGGGAAGPGATQGPASALPAATGGGRGAEGGGY